MNRNGKISGGSVAKKPLLRIAVLAMLVSLVCVLIPRVSDTVFASKLTDSKVKNYEAQLDQLNRDMENLKKQVATAKSDIDKAIKEKERLDGEMNILIQKIEVTNALIAELSGSIDQKNTEIADKEQAYAKKYELFKTRLRATHEDGQVTYLEMVFGASSLSDFLVRVDRIGAMLEYDNLVMASLKQEKEDLESVRSDYETQRLDQQKYREELKVAEAELLQKQQQSASYLANLKNQQANYEAVLAKKKEAEEELQDQLQAYLKELAAKQNNKYVGGKFMWPLPLKYTTASSEYGRRISPITGKYEGHNGIDIPAPYGTEIYAANDGTVTISTTHWSYGNYIMIDHGGGYATLYAHASKLLVNKGDKVKKGDVIAKVGSTGQSTGNHLHFSVYENSTLTNPRKWFPK